MEVKEEGQQEQKNGFSQREFAQELPVKRDAFKTVLLTLFILSFGSLFLGLAFVLVVTDFGLQDFIAKMWGMYLALPLTLACLGLGITGKKRGYKCKKNIIAGIIFSVLLLIYGSFPLFLQETYSRDYTLVSRVSQTINFALPKEGEIFTQLDVGGSKTDSKVKFTSSAEIEAFVSGMSDSGLFTTSLATKNKALLPFMHTHAKYDYYMIYCLETGQHNEMPFADGEYNFIFLGYDAKTKVLSIVEYSCQISN